MKTFFNVLDEAKTSFYIAFKTDKNDYLYLKGDGTVTDDFHFAKEIKSENYVTEVVDMLNKHNINAYILCYFHSFDNYIIDKFNTEDLKLDFNEFIKTHREEWSIWFNFL